MVKLPKDFFSDPTTLACSGFIAMIPKLAISAFLAFIAAILAKHIGAFFAFLIMLYPFVAIVVDLVLYALKDWLWKPLPENALIPNDWNINAAELVQYAKQLPKARLMRVLTSPPLMALVIQEWDLLMAAIGFTFFFSIGVFFDSRWLKFFNVKSPTLFKTTIVASDCQHCKRRFNNTDPSRLGSAAWTREQMNATTPGTPAWVSRQHIDSL